ncbi:hypothetical protein ILYODFUR_023086 [Ilyodon furcidens]|uniref:Uncharacterized protein n=1 Tax=Ilyodon furcidens TaxID=33524 RepID=A0ABV0TQ16_9TELE
MFTSKISGLLRTTQQQQQRLQGIHGRLGISREGHGILAGSFTTPTGCEAGAAGAVTGIRGEGVGGRVNRAVKLREVEDKSVGDYFATNGPDGPLGDGELPAMFVLLYAYEHEMIKTKKLHRFVIQHVMIGSFI